MPRWAQHHGLAIWNRWPPLLPSRRQPAETSMRPAVSPPPERHHGKAASRGAATSCYGSACSSSGQVTIGSEQKQPCTDHTWLLYNARARAHVRDTQGDANATADDRVACKAGISQGPSRRAAAARRPKLDHVIDSWVPSGWLRAMSLTTGIIEGSPPTGCRMQAIILPYWPGLTRLRRRKASGFCRVHTVVEGQLLVIQVAFWRSGQETR